MPVTVSQKICSKCKEVKPASEFYKRGDILRPRCKECSTQDRLEYAKTESGKLVSRKAGGKYARTDNGSKVNAARMSRYRKRHLQKGRARGRLNHALKIGKLIRPRICSCCLQESRRTTGHHHKGYSNEHALDVIWLCVPCHFKAERDDQANTKHYAG